MPYRLVVVEPINDENIFAQKSDAWLERVGFLDDIDFVDLNVTRLSRRRGNGGKHEGTEHERND